MLFRSLLARGFSAFRSSSLAWRGRPAANYIARMHHFSYHASLHDATCALRKHEVRTPPQVQGGNGRASHRGSFHRRLVLGAKARELLFSATVDAFRAGQKLLPRIFIACRACL